MARGDSDREKLQMLPDWTECLKSGITAERLDRQATAMTDIESAQRMQQARNELLQRCRAL